MTRHTLSAVFDDAQQAERAVEELSEVGVSKDAYQVVEHHRLTQGQLAALPVDATNVRRGVLRGALTGCGLALVLGVIAALSDFVNWWATLGVIALGTVAGALGAGLISSSLPRRALDKAGREHILVAVAVDDAEPGPPRRAIKHALEHSGGRLVPQPS